MKRIALLGLLLLSPTVFAEEPTGELNDKCILSVRNVYKFYYHSIHPNPNPACHTNKLIDDQQKKEMDAVIGELKKDCPAYLIAQVNQTLVQDKAKG